MAKAPTYKLTVVMTDKNLIEAEWKFFTLTQRKIFWYIAKRMQEHGYTKDSLYIKDVLTPEETKILNLETGQLEVSTTSKVFTLLVNLEALYKETKISYEAVREAIEKYQKTTLKFKDKEAKREIVCSVIPRAEFTNDRQSIKLSMYAEMAHLLLELQGYISMNLSKILEFKSNYTLRFYEYLNKVKKQNFPEFTLTLEEANKMFDTNYKRMKHLEDFIIKPSLEELNEKSNISFEYMKKLEKDKKTSGRRAIVGYRFFVTKNTPQRTLF